MNMFRVVPIFMAFAFYCFCMDENAESVMIQIPESFYCGDWEMASQLNRIRDRVWVSGYLSGYNTYSRKGEEVELPDANAIDVWISNYCSEHPLDFISKAAFELIKELRQRRGLSPTVSG